MNIIAAWLSDLQQRLAAETLDRAGGADWRFLHCRPAFYGPRRGGFYPARFKRYGLLSQICGSSPTSRTYGWARGLDAS